jgi:hypothetical protein
LYSESTNDQVLAKTPSIAKLAKIMDSGFEYVAYKLFSDPLFLAIPVDAHPL